MNPCCDNPKLKPMGNGYYWCMSCAAIIEPESKATRTFIEQLPSGQYAVSQEIATGLDLGQAISLAREWRK